MELILKYLPKISDVQVKQFEMLMPLYQDWNNKINLISRQDIHNLYERHILHSLAIANVINFKDGSNVLDAGTGGGFPGIPLAILFPNVKFHLVDSIGKKLKVASDIAEQIGLTNCTFSHNRIEKETGEYDFIVSRAVMPLPDLCKLSKHLISKKNKNALPNGYIVLKGGNIAEEMKPLSKKIEVYDISETFKEEFFDTKKIVYLPI